MKQRFRNVLFVGIGGGNDIFSTTLAMASLRHLDWWWINCAMAGILSPFHRHTAKSTNIPEVFEINPTTQRFLIRRDNPKQIGFIDTRVSQMIQEEEIFDEKFGVKGIYGLSINNGTKGLAAAFKELRKNFDFFVLVDIGGDCFYNGDASEHVLSPMFDSIAIRAFIASGVPGILFEAGPGTDGELSFDLLKKVLSKAILHRIDDTTINWWEKIYSKWIRNERPGRTIPITIEAYRSDQDVIHVDYRARAHLGEKRYYKYFSQAIDTYLCSNFYLIDPRIVQNPFALFCRNPKEWFIKTQVHQHPTNNEANLEYLPQRDGLWQFLTPSPLFARDERMKIIEQAFDEFDQKNICDGIWMFVEDWNSLPAECQNRYKHKMSDGMIKVYLH